MAETRTPAEIAAFWARIDEILGEEDAAVVRQKMGSVNAVERFRSRWSAVTTPLKKMCAHSGSQPEQTHKGEESSRGFYHGKEARANGSL